MTVLIQEMSATVIAAVNSWTMTLADFTVLPKKDIFKVAIDKNPALKEWITSFVQRKAEEKRVSEGFQIQNPDDFALERVETADSEIGRLDDEEDIAPDAETDKQATPPVLRTVNDENCGERDDEQGTDHNLARQLAQTIKGVAKDLRVHPPKRYSFEDWVRFTKLIRFSPRNHRRNLETIEEEIAGLEEEEGLVEWDWLGENSPMLADITEAEWVLDRLCESLTRYTERQAMLGLRRHVQSLDKSDDEID